MSSQYVEVRKGIILFKGKISRNLMVEPITSNTYILEDGDEITIFEPSSIILESPPDPPWQGHPTYYQKRGLQSVLKDSSQYFAGCVLFDDFLKLSDEPPAQGARQ
jgi:hypothetical protein